MSLVVDENMEARREYFFAARISRDHCTVMRCAMNTAIPLQIPRWQRGVSARGAHRVRRQVQSAEFAKPDLSRGERMLARNDNAVATDRALHLRDGATGWRSVAWSALAGARWSRATGALTVQEWPTEAHSAAVARFTADAAFASVVAERVNASRVLCVEVDLGHGLRGTVFALRAIEALRWLVVCHGADGETVVVPERDWPSEVREIQALAG
jgi:hypothetical protein